MDEPNILSNSSRSDRLLRSKLLVLKRTLRIRGVEVEIIKSDNNVVSKVHGFNAIELPGGDRADEVKITKSRLVLNLNNLDHVGEKGAVDQTVYHYKDIADEGDTVLYRSGVYEYAFKVDRKSVYGEHDFLYEYELNHFRTIKVSQEKREVIVYKENEIDKEFKTHEGNKSEVAVNPEPDWRDRIKDLNII